MILKQETLERNNENPSCSLSKAFLSLNQRHYERQHRWRRALCGPQFLMLPCHHVGRDRFHQQVLRRSC